MINAKINDKNTKIKPYIKLIYLTDNGFYILDDYNKINININDTNDIKIKHIQIKYFNNENLIGRDNKFDYSLGTNYNDLKIDVKDYDNKEKKLQIMLIKILNEIDIQCIHVISYLKLSENNNVNVYNDLTDNCELLEHSIKEKQFKIQTKDNSKFYDLYKMFMNVYNQFFNIFNDHDFFIKYIIKDNHISINEEENTITLSKDNKIKYYNIDDNIKVIINKDTVSSILNGQWDEIKSNTLQLLKETINLLLNIDSFYPVDKLLYCVIYDQTGIKSSIKFLMKRTVERINS